MLEEKIVSGTILLGEDFEPFDGYLCLKEGIITEIGEGEVDSSMKGLIAPCFVNAHTHIGDSVIKDPPPASLEDLVHPRYGLKQRALRETPFKKLVECMRHTAIDMINTGTCAFADFREGGLTGLTALKEAVKGLDIHTIMLGRPEEGEDLNSILREGDGIGLSSTRDIDPLLCRKAVEFSRKARKLFVIHAGEKNPRDIRSAVDLNPNFLVHLTHAVEEDLRLIFDAGISVVVCPRSNLVTGAGTPPIKKMLQEGLSVSVGTDNVMLNSINMFSEMEFISKIFIDDDRQVFKMCTLNGAKLLGLGETCISEGNRVRLMVLNKNSNNLFGAKNPLRSIVRRARPDDIIRII